MLPPCFLVVVIFFVLNDLLALEFPFFFGAIFGAPKIPPSHIIELLNVRMMVGYGCIRPYGAILVIRGEGGGGSPPLLHPPATLALARSCVRFGSALQLGEVAME